MKKRTTLLFLLFLLPSLMLSAQENRVILVPRLSIASVTENNVSAFNNDSYDNSHILAYIYRDYYGPMLTTGNITASLDVILSKACAVSLDLGFTPIWRDAYDGISKEYVYTQRGGALSVIPQFKFFYMNRPVVRLYGDVGIGVVMFFNTSSSLRFAAQFVPFGIEVGKKCFGFVELGLGSSYIGARGGIGYRF